MKYITETLLCSTIFKLDYFKKLNKRFKSENHKNNEKSYIWDGVLTCTNLFAMERCSVD